METSQEKFLMHRFPIVILLITCLVLMGGCGGKREVDELAFVLGMGIDLGKEEGTYLITMQMAQPKPSGGGGAAELENRTISMEAPSLAIMVERVAETFNKYPFAGTARVIVLGEELSKSGINETLDFFQRFYEFRRSIYLLVAKGDAKDLLETELRTKKIPSHNLISTIESQKRQSAFPTTRLGHYLTILGRESQNPIIPTVEKVKSGDKDLYLPNDEGEELLIHKSCVFEDGKLVATLNDQETNGFLWLDDEIYSRYLYKKDENGIGITAWVLNSKTKYKIEEIDGKMGITFKIKARVAINEISGKHEEMDTKKWRDFMESLGPILEQAIQEECEAAVAKNRELGLDFIGIGRKIEIKEPKYWKQVKSTWPHCVSDTPVAYSIEVSIEHSGLARNSPVSPQKSESKEGSKTPQ
ncbi:Ger(x)C family spore germination protein [Desulfitobacterium dichloroeliminans]|nr:Ger(x)C family spore germination protein [Desulfitobacterium dichloroeliminans]